MSARVCRRWAWPAAGILVFLALGVAAVAIPSVASARPGAVLWDKEWRPAASPVTTVYNAVAPNGNVYVGGLESDGESATSFLVTCYKPGGGVLWSRSAPLDATLCDLTGLAADGKSGVVLTGFAKVGGGPLVWVTCRWSAAGVLRYQKTVDMEGARALDLVCDGAGNAYVAGAVGIESPTASQWCVVKYDREGAVVWSQTFRGAGSAGDWASEIARDSDGRIYVAGISRPDWAEYEVTLLKYTSDGKRLWKRFWDEPAGVRGVSVADLAATRDGAAICGTVADADYRLHPFALRYAPSGKLAWARTYRLRTTETGSYDVVAMDSGGNVVVAGAQSADSPEDWGMLVARYGPGGVRAWSRLRSFAGSNGRAGSLALDAYGNAFVTGANWYTTAGPQTACITWSLTPAGTSRWSRVRSGLGFATDIAVTRTAAYVVGNHGDVGGFVVKYVR